MDIFAIEIDKGIVVVAMLAASHRFMNLCEPLVKEGAFKLLKEGFFHQRFHISVSYIECGDNGPPTMESDTLVFDAANRVATKQRDGVEFRWTRRAAVLSLEINFQVISHSPKSSSSTLGIRTFD